MFDLINQEQALALGRLSVTFMALDELLTSALCDLMQCTDKEVATRVVGEMNFSRRADKLLELAKHHSSKYPVEKGTRTGLERAAKHAKQIAERRNALIHARLKFKKGQPMALASTKTGIEIDASVGTIENLMREVLGRHD